ncbi:MAG: hypothetical protein Kow00122_16150 [Thermoleophilia bacterium]
MNPSSGQTPHSRGGEPGGTELVLYSAPGCSLCAKALEALRPLQEELGFRLRVVDISRDEALEARYRPRIPVGEVGGRVAFKYHVDAERVRRLVREAASGSGGAETGPDRAGLPHTPAGRPRFLADEMLGRLARWLRVMGYDTEWKAAVADADLLRQAESEGRVLLTRDTGLMERRAVRRGRVRAVFVRDDILEDQLRQLTSEEGLRPGSPRCMVCNGELEPISRQRARPHVPAYVGLTQVAFRRCRGCGRVVWPGSHWEGIRATVRRVHGDPADERWGWGV